MIDPTDILKRISISRYYIRTIESTATFEDQNDRYGYKRTIESIDILKEIFISRSLY